MFIAADIQKRSLKRKQSELQFTQMIKSNKLNNTTAKLKAMESVASKQDKASSSKDYTSTVATDAMYDQSTAYGKLYHSLEVEQAEYDAAVDSIDSQLKLIDAQITSMDKLVQNNISQDCTLWCVGGSN